MLTKKIAATLIALVLCLSGSASAQRYSMLHSFTGGHDGSHPISGLVMDGAGNLYGTTPYGGSMQGICGEFGGCGTVFRLSQKNGEWLFTTLYAFQGGEDGEAPQSGLTIGPDGALYGTTLYGGAFDCSLGYGCGTVFKVTPASGFCGSATCGWKEKVIFSFPEQGFDGISTPYGGVVFDAAGNIYGAAFGGGLGVCSYACGVIYELTPGGNGRWGLTPLYEFTGGSDGGSPMSTLLRDSHGNLYGTAWSGGYGNNGTVFELSPSGQNWTFKLLHEFQGQGDGKFPVSAVVMDAAGNLYGDTSDGPNNAGVIFEITPNGDSLSFQAIDSPLGGVAGPMNIDSAGSLYGTTSGGGTSNQGSIFKLVRDGNTWSQQILHSFDGVDGAIPYSGVLFDSSGRLYGTTDGGGGMQVGVVWEFAP